MASASSKLSIISSLFLLLLTAAVLPGAVADNCKHVPLTACYICGKAVNKTPWTMLYTTNPGGACKSSCCQVLNWNSGDGGWSNAFANPSSKLVACTQKSLAAGKTAGGNTCHASGRVDVDAITFADRDFVIAEYVGHTFHEKTVKKGVWVKFSSLDTVTCTNKNGKPYCAE